MSDARSLADKFVLLVPLLMRNASYDLRCMNAGLAPSHMRLLGLLMRKNYTLSELAEMQAVTLATISNSVGTMVERGWVERIPVPTDRRAVQIAITPAGSQFLEEVHARLKERITAQFAGLSTAEQEQLETGLAILTRVLERTGRRPGVSACDDESVELPPLHPVANIVERE